MRRPVAGLMMVALVATVLSGCPGPSGSGVGADCGASPKLTAGASLFGCNLSGFDLSGLDLTGADLHGADLSSSQLVGTNLSNANLEGANLTGANLTSANLTGAILSGALLLGAVFINALLGGAALDFGSIFNPPSSGGGSGGGCTDVNDVNCAGYDEASAKQDATICGPSPDPTFTDNKFITRTHEQLIALGERSVATDAATDFSGAVFDHSDVQVSSILLRGLSLSQANFTNAVFKGATFACKDGTAARFEGAQFLPGNRNGEFLSVDLVDANFNGARFLNQAFCDVNIGGSSFQAAQLSDNRVGCPSYWDESLLGGLSPYLLSAANVDFSGADFGVEYGPSLFGNPAGTRANLFGYTLGDESAKSDFSGAIFDGATMVDTFMANSLLTGATAVGLQSTGFQRWDGVAFPESWAGSNLSGQADTDGATCPDSTAGGPANTCFAGLSYLDISELDITSGLI